MTEIKINDIPITNENILYLIEVFNNKNVVEQELKIVDEEDNETIIKFLGVIEK